MCWKFFLRARRNNEEDDLIPSGSEHAREAKSATPKRFTKPRPVHLHNPSVVYHRDGYYVDVDAEGEGYSVEIRDFPRRAVGVRCEDGTGVSFDTGVILSGKITLDGITQEETFHFERDRRHGAEYTDILLVSDRVVVHCNVQPQRLKEKSIVSSVL